MVSIFVTFLGGVNERGMLLLFPVLNLLMAAVPSAAPQLLQPALLKLLGLILAGKVCATGYIVLIHDFVSRQQHNFSGVLKQRRQHGGLAP